MVLKGHVSDGEVILDDPIKLPKSVAVSAISFWEIALLARHGRNMRRNSL